MVVYDEWVCGSNQHVDSKVELVVHVKQKGVSNVFLGKKGVFHNATFSTILILFLYFNSLFFIEEEDTLGFVGSVADFDDILDCTLLEALLVSDGVDHLKEVLTFFIV